MSTWTFHPVPRYWRRSGNPEFTAVNYTISERDFEGTIKNLGLIQALVEKYPETFTIVRNHSDISRAKRDNRLGIIPGFQDTTFLEEDPGRIEMFRNLGVRIMQITYNNRGAFGDGCLEPGNAGLSKAGTAAVKKMNDIGVAVDVSHSGYRTTQEAISASSKPVLISHAGCAAVYPHPRNKPDEILKSLADRGGYFGVYLMPYLVASPAVPTREHVLDHLLHAINVCGADHVGIGSDGSIEKVVLTPAQKAEFDADIARRKKLGIGAPGRGPLSLRTRSEWTRPYGNHRSGACPPRPTFVSGRKGAGLEFSARAGRNLVNRKTLNHQGHEVSRRVFVSMISFVYLRDLRG